MWLKVEVPDELELRLRDLARILGISSETGLDKAAEDAIILGLVATFYQGAVPPEKLPDVIRNMAAAARAKLTETLSLEEARVELGL